MPAAKRVRTPPTDDWDTLQLHFSWPEQQQYELIRPVVLFGQPLLERAEETGAAVRTLAAGLSEADRRLVGLYAEAQHAMEPDQRQVAWMAFLRAVMKTEMTVVICGKVGSGKTYLAQRIHEFSGRRGSYIELNCGRLPRS